MLSLISQNDSDVNKLLKGADISPMAFSGVLNSKLEKRVEETPADNVKENSHIPFSQITDSIIRDSIREANNYEHSKIVEPRHLLLAILRNDKNPVANWLSQLGLSYDRAIEMLYPTDKDDEQKTEEPKDFKMDPQTPDSEIPDADRQEKAENLEMAGGIGTEDDYNEQNDMMETDEEPFDMEKDQNPMRLSTRSNGTPRKKSSTPTIDKFSFDLTKAAADGKLDPVVGREKEIQRVLEILGRRKKNNPVLIGEPGVGKSAIVEGLAQLINNQETSPMFFNKRLVSLDLTAIVAGTKFRGQFEERIKNVIKELEDHPEIIIFIDEIHTMIGAGGAEGAIDASSILKPSLARGEIQLIGATTREEYRKYIEKDAAFERRFQPVAVEEPTKEEAVAILNGLKEKYEQHHHVHYTAGAIQAAVELSERYISDRFLPDKAIDVMDEAASKKRVGLYTMSDEMRALEEQFDKYGKRKEEALAEGNLRKAKTNNTKQKTVLEKLEEQRKLWEQKKAVSRVNVTENDVAEVVSSWTKIPVTRISQSESQRLLGLEDTLKKRVIGQDEAVKMVAKAIKRGRVGLKDPKRPIGSFMFLGPTGVGKTELSKALAEALFGDENAMIRVDMSEYMEKHSVSKLIGSPPGYVGYEEGGQLSEQVRRHPYSVILFDEIEKAHGDVFNILLQVLDDGQITDSNGRKADFKNTVIIMTSNAGAQRIMAPKNLGFITERSAKEDHERMKSHVMEEVKQIFKPEFINRVDGIMVFHTLEKPEQRKIVELLLKELSDRLSKNPGFTLEFSDKVADYVLEKGYDPQYGARPLRRAIQNELEDFLADEYLEGHIKNNDRILLDINDGKPVVKKAEKKKK